ncbi:MAG: MBL fold metallo-hydrolase [Candidatus Azobacteroides sp.]|nr:MBL fold metallo-hydrolase [Candidatus Azobacteroides sp.]
MTQFSNLTIGAAGENRSAEMKEDTTSKSRGNLKKAVFFVIFFVIFFRLHYAQSVPQIEGEVVFSNKDVVFHRIDNHTWIGTGNLMFSESLYIVEGDDKAVLIDAGTKIADLDKIVASITSKPVTLVATHVHPDHTGSAINYYPAIWINPGDTTLVPSIMGDYKGEINFLKDGEILELGGRQLEVVFTPGHTPGSVTFIDTKAGYGFSGDAFGSGNLLLGVDFSTLIATCRKMETVMQNNNIKYLYPGHFYGSNLETLQRIRDLITLSEDVMSRRIAGKPNQYGGLVVNNYGVNIVYYEQQVK